MGHFCVSPLSTTWPSINWIREAYSRQMVTVQPYALATLNQHRQQHTKYKKKEKWASDGIVAYFTHLTQHGPLTSEFPTRSFLCEYVLSPKYRVPIYVEFFTVTRGLDQRCGICCLLQNHQVYFCEMNSSEQRFLSVAPFPWKVRIRGVKFTFQFGEYLLLYTHLPWSISTQIIIYYTGWFRIHLPKFHVRINHGIWSIKKVHVSSGLTWKVYEVGPNGRLKLRKTHATNGHFPNNFNVNWSKGSLTNKTKSLKMFTGDINAHSSLVCYTSIRIKIRTPSGISRCPRKQDSMFSTDTRTI